MVTVTVSGLTPLELRELENKLGKDAVSELRNVSPSANFPEPISLIVATVVLSAAALSALAIIATRPRKSAKRVLRIEYASASETYSIDLEEDMAASESPDAKVVEKITKGLALDPKTLEALTKG